MDCITLDISYNLAVAHSRAKGVKIGALRLLNAPAVFRNFDTHWWPKLFGVTKGDFFLATLAQKYSEFRISYILFSVFTRL